MDEQEANDRFVRLVGGVKRANRLQQIWNMRAYREIDAFLNLP